MHIRTFLPIALQYKVICFDAYGVLKNHRGIIPGISRTLEVLDGEGIDYYVLTNDASRSPSKLASVYRQAGVPQITEEKIISSGMLALSFLQDKVKDGTVAYLGPERSAHYVAGVGLKTISIRDLNPRDIEHINALALLDDEGFSWEEDLNKAINLLRSRNIPVIIANTDKTYPVSRNEVAIAIGSIGNLLESIVGKTFLRFGKPDAQMFHFAYDHIRQKGPFQKSDILMVGDTLGTDILGGNKFGIDTVLVLTGNTLPHKAEAKINATGIKPDYVCESVAK
ncbi:MAG: HAD-IIA family hydrolase [Bacteroidota bacterium]